MSEAPFDVWCDRCGCEMKLRKGKFGEFYGCTGYPKCMRTKNLHEIEDDFNDKYGDRDSIPDTFGEDH